MTRLRTGRARGFGAEMLRHGVLLSVLIAVTLIGYRSSSLTGIGDFNDVGLKAIEVGRRPRGVGYSALKG
jgi:hypothetical protein